VCVCVCVCVCMCVRVCLSVSVFACVCVDMHDTTLFLHECTVFPATALAHFD